MKKILLQIVFFLSATIAMAQTDIQFSILKAEADGVSASVTNALDLKLRQVFDRNGAGAADLYNVFAIEPTISVEKIISTKDGVVLDVPIAQGELVLIAKNIIDGAEYYSTSIELEGESLGSKDKAMKSMIKGIKVTDPAYKQFINTARKKIEEYYSTNCAFILQKAKALTISSVTKKLLAISLLPLPISHAMIRLTLCRSKFLQSWEQSRTL